ncbi:MAG TPA: response regulator [Anaerolineae bacterium]|nr:response regulator [Anaerolineae bacterium]
MPDLPKILTVDDKPENLFALRKLLANLPVELIEAQSGMDALAHTLDHQFCMAIVDVQMPEMDGYELVSLLRGNRATANLPIIFISAIYSDEYHHRKGYDAGAVDFLSKPFVPEILISKIKVFLNLYEQQQQLQQANEQISQFNEDLEQVIATRTNELDQAQTTLSQQTEDKANFARQLIAELTQPVLDIAALDPSPQIQTIQTILDTTAQYLNFDNRQLIFQPCQLQPIFDTIIHDLEPTLGQRQITIELENINTLPTIEADPTLLTTLGQQLILNAIKHTPNNGFILITGYNLHRETPPEIEIQIRDTGVGLDPQHIDQLFTPFTSNQRTTFPHGSSQLALPLAQRITEAHDGRIWAESPAYNPDTLPGTVIHLRLPLD